MDTGMTVAVALALVALAALCISVSIFLLVRSYEVFLRVRPRANDPEDAFSGDWHGSRKVVEPPAPLAVLPRGMAPGMDVGYDHDVLFDPLNPPWADEEVSDG